MIFEIIEQKTKKGDIQYSEMEWIESIQNDILQSINNNNIEEVHYIFDSNPDLKQLFEKYGATQLFDLLSGKMQPAHGESIKEIKQMIQDAAFQSASTDSCLLTDHQESVIESINDLLKSITPNIYVIKANNMGWRRTSGSKIARITSFQDLCDKVFPKTSEFSFYLTIHGEGSFSINLSHHDAHGELYEFDSLTPKLAYDLYKEDTSQLETIAESTIGIENSPFAQLICENEMTQSQSQIDICVNNGLTPSPSDSDMMDRIKKLLHIGIQDDNYSAIQSLINNSSCFSKRNMELVTFIQSLIDKENISDETKKVLNNFIK